MMIKASTCLCLSRHSERWLLSCYMVDSIIFAKVAVHDRPLLDVCIELYMSIDSFIPFFFQSTPWSIKSNMH